MKSLLLLTAACALTASAALAQTTAPPGTVPGSLPVVTPDMRNAGSPRASRHDEKVPGLSHQERKRLRKLSKPRELPADKALKH